MAKEGSKTKGSPKSELASRLDILFQVGNYAAVRKLSKTHSDDAQVAQLVQRMEPEPLVFWIGVGSVAVATALAFWLVH